MIYNLHFLRVVAALAVVYFHATSEAGLNLRLNIGSRGVDLFFVISGFIIAQISSGTNPSTFFVRRLIRVAPFYWGATIFVFIIAYLFPGLMRSTTADTEHLIYSLAFIPHFSVSADGMFPTLILGWSLNYEIYFYAVFAVALALCREQAPIAVSGFICAVVCLTAVFEFNSPILQFYGRTIALEFVFGVLVFYSCKVAMKYKTELARIPQLKWLLIATLAFSLAVICAFEMSDNLYPRFIVAGVPAYFTVLSAVLVERIYGVFTRNRLVHLLGESSYIIYLIHPYIVYAVLRVFLKGVVLDATSTVLLVVGLLALTSAVATSLHLWFEKPVMSALRRRVFAAD